MNISEHLNDIGKTVYANMGNNQIVKGKIHEVHFVFKEGLNKPTIFYNISSDIPHRVEGGLIIKRNVVFNQSELNTIID